MWAVFHFLDFCIWLAGHRSVPFVTRIDAVDDFLVGIKVAGKGDDANNMLMSVFARGGLLADLGDIVGGHGELSRVGGLRLTPLVTMPDRSVADSFDVRGDAWIQLARAFNGFCLGGFNRTGSLGTGALDGVVALGATLYIDTFITHGILVVEVIC